MGKLIVLMDAKGNRLMSTLWVQREKRELKELREGKETKQLTVT